MTEQLERFITLLKGIFELDKSDLDFGIYRIMNIRKKEIEKFLTEGLPQKVQEALKPFATDTAAAESRIKEIETQLGGSASIAALPPTVPMVKEYVELKTQLAKGVDSSGLEADVYSHLYSFFNRYYEEGDFISKRRYKEGVYAIPYEGEEVKLYWANQDQYYIKTSENFKDYTFVAEGYTIHFKLVDATTEQNNNKESADNKRVFMLYTENPEQPELKTFEFDAEKKEFIIRFIFDVPPEKKFDYAADNVKKIIQWIATNCSPLVTVLLPNISNDPQKPLTLVEKHLKAYVAKNTFDYFIHKDLHKFLSRELDFYIKNEVMHLDDVDTPDEKQVSTYLARVRAIKRVGKILIEFLASIEDFQKKLWLKKKFVVQCDYCITLDRISEEFYPEIAENPLQWQEWAKLGLLRLEFGGGYMEKNMPSNPKDITVFFADKPEMGYGYLFDGSGQWVENCELEKLKQSGNLGLASVISANQLFEKHKFLMIDTKFFSDDFKSRLLASIDDFDKQCDGLLIHSENFQALNFMQERYKEKVKCVYIDPPYNTGNDGFIYRDQYKNSNWLSMIIDRVISAKKLMSEKSVFYSSIGEEEISSLKHLLSTIFANGHINTLVTRRQDKNLSLQFIDDGLPSLSVGFEYVLVYRKQCTTSITPVFTKNSEDRSISGYWKGFWNDADRPSMRYDVLGFTPQSGQWKWKQEKATEAVENYKEYLSKYSSSESLEEYWERTGKCLKFIRRNPYGKGKSQGVEHWVSPSDEKLKTSNWTDVLTLKAISNTLGLNFPSPKNDFLIQQLLQMSIEKKSVVLDYFAGSGTTAHSVINLNREDEGHRKYILVDMGEHFNTVMMPRIKKVVFSPDWKDGKPETVNNGVSHCFKYLTLESYEDALSNVVLPDEETTGQMIARFGDEYLLKYMLSLNTADDMLNLKAFAEPFCYKLKVTEKNETKEVNVDLMETFNYLIGLTVEKLYARNTFTAVSDPPGEYEGAVKLTADKNGNYTFRQVEGKLPDGRRCLILWRNVTENLTESNAALDAYFQRYRINSADREYDLIYVNGDNNLENLKAEDETWKVRMIEPEFKKRMFEEK